MTMKLVTTVLAFIFLVSNSALAATPSVLDKTQLAQNSVIAITTLSLKTRGIDISGLKVSIADTEVSSELSYGTDFLVAVVIKGAKNKDVYESYRVTVNKKGQVTSLSLLNQYELD